MNSPYTVPIIPQNLSKNETIIQIAEVLNHLSNITEDVFGRVNKRFENNNQKLLDISSRLDIVNKKIIKLKGAKKATQVFSSSKYPASDINREYTSIFRHVEPLELKRHTVKHKTFTSTNEPLDKLQFYHVKISNRHNPEKLEGLGDIPTNITCVNDLLLYNSGKNLYKNFVITDSLNRPQHIKEGDHVDTSDIGAAPASISERSTLTRSVTQNYLYSPKSGETPALDVPLDLPDLPGIADDLRYENEVGPAIGPSASSQDIAESIIDLPAIDLPAIIETVSNSKDVLDIPVNVTLSIPHPPPIQNVHVTPSIEPPVPTPVQTEHPIPIPVEIKPPIPIPVQIPESERSKSTKNNVEEKVPEVDALPQNDMRASLMEAIRNAGGSRKAHLKSTEREASKTKPPSGDLMADLHSKLLMRRKGISGAKKPVQDNAIDSKSTLGKISAMIPPPAAKNEESTSSNEEDWDN